jgi:hypothetical protein
MLGFVNEVVAPLHAALPVAARPAAPSCTHALHFFFFVLVLGFFRAGQYGGGGSLVSGFLPR